MRIVARYLLWILIAVLPMQGSAAAFMALAASPAAPVAVMTPEGHCDQVGAGQHHTASATDADAGQAHSTCSTCASCCIGACAPPADYVPPLPHLQPNDTLASLEPAMTAYIPATLERPPRRPA
jgi:cytochrome c553